MKSIWIYNHYAQEPGGPGGTRHFSLAVRLRDLGWQVVIFASSIEHGTGRQRLPEGTAIKIENHEGVRFVWLRGSTYRNNGLARLRNIAEYCAAALDSGKLDLPHPDVIIGSSVHPFAALIASRIARRFRVPFVFEVRDLWPETIIAMGKLTRRHPVALAMRTLEKHLYNKAALIISLLPNADDYITSLGVPHEKIRWLPNGVDIKCFPVLETPAKVKRTFTFMYLGSHGIANGLEPILRAFALLAGDRDRSSIRLRMIGDGPRKGALIVLATELGIADIVSFEAPIAKSQVPQAASQADAFVANVRDLPLYKYGISLNKIFDYLAAARPIVFASNSINNPVVEAGAGKAIAADDIDAIFHAMRDIMQMSPEDREEMGARGRSYVEQTHDYGSLALKLSDWLSALTNRQDVPR